MIKDIGAVEIHLRLLYCAAISNVSLGLFHNSPITHSVFFCTNSISRLRILYLGTPVTFMLSIVHHQSLPASNIPNFKTTLVAHGVFKNLPQPFHFVGKTFGLMERIDTAGYLQRTSCPNRLGLLCCPCCQGRSQSCQRQSKLCPDRQMPEAG